MVLYRGVRLVCPVRLGTPNEGPPEEVRFVVAPMSEGRERPERLGVSEYHILFGPLWVGQHIVVS